MHFTVSLSIDLPATATIETIEPLIVDAGHHAMRAALLQAALVAQAHVQTCPACGHPHLHADGTSRRVVLASFSRVEVPVLRKRCAACGVRFRASADFFAPLAGANITPELGQQAALAGADAPFARATHALEQHTGAQLSPESLRLQTIMAPTSLTRSVSRPTVSLLPLPARSVLSARQR